MKNLNRLFILCIMLLAFLPMGVKAQEKVNIYLFHGQECSKCAAERAYLKTIEQKYDYVEIHYYEVYHNAANEQVMINAKKVFGVDQNGVPFTVIGDKSILGYASFQNSNIEQAIKDYQGDNPEFIKVINGIPADKIDKVVVDEINLPLLGKVNLKAVSLPLITVILGTLDGFNPCAMWVLLFLISMLLGMNDRKKMWILGVTFLFTSALVYFLVMLAWIQITASFSTVVWLRTLIALVAIVGGMINLRSAMKKVDDGCEVVDDQKRKKIFERVKDFTTQKSFVLALLGVMALAISVNVIELACSAGLPLLFSQIMTINNLSPVEYFMYTTLYIFFFLLDDLIVFTIAMVSLKMTGISTKYGKYSHLIGGILMLIIGALLIFKPEWIMLNF